MADDLCSFHRQSGKQLVHSNLFQRGGLYTMCYKPGGGSRYVAFSCTWNVTGPTSLSGVSGNRSFNGSSCVPTGLGVTLNFTGNALVTGASGDQVRVVPVGSGGVADCSAGVAEAAQSGNTNLLFGTGGSTAQYATTFLRGGTHAVCYKACGGDYVALGQVVVCGPSGFTPNGTTVVCGRACARVSVCMSCCELTGVGVVAKVTGLG